MPEARINTGFQHFNPLFELLFVKLFCGVFRWFLRQKSGSFVRFLPIVWICGRLYCHFVVTVHYMNSFYFGQQLYSIPLEFS